MFDKELYAKNRLLDIVAEQKFDYMADVLPEGDQGVDDGEFHIEASPQAQPRLTVYPRMGATQRRRSDVARSYCQPGLGRARRKPTRSVEPFTTKTASAPEASMPEKLGPT
jgi:hypothetical protein